MNRFRPYLGGVQQTYLYQYRNGVEYNEGQNTTKFIS
jgi:hypothetical protein